MRAEEWRSAGRGPYAEYEVSNLGRVRSTSPFNRTPRILKGVGSNGYRVVYMFPRDAVPVHRLVAGAFLPAPAAGQSQVNHIDGDRSNNRADNLEWVTPAENLRHSREVLGNRPPRGERAGAAKVTALNAWEIREMRRQGRTMRSIAESFGICVGTVRRCLRGYRP